MPLLLFQITVNGQLNAQGITFKIQYWEDHLFIKQREVLLMNKIEIIRDKPEMKHALMLGIELINVKRRCWVLN